MSDEIEILKLLEARRNVLLSGPPGTGKSMLLSKVATLFKSATDNEPPHYKAHSEIPIPSLQTTSLPSNIAKAKNRKVFRCVLHQSSKYRDFLTGMVPDVRPDKLPGTFRITKGILYQASEYAKQTNHAALLIIDEINRGPTVQVFGGSIVAIEADKRLADDGKPTNQTQYFEILNPSDGEMIECAFPSQLYILSAMNQADVSVEPLDVAFLRRWAPYNLEPSANILRDHFGLSSESPSILPDEPSSNEDIFKAAVGAFEGINHRIALGRGNEFRIGHGVLMAEGGMPSSTDDVLDHFATAWCVIKNHIDETFFGDVRGTAIVLNADKGLPHNPYVLEETYFGEAPKAQIRGPLSVTKEQIYGLLLAMSNTGD